MKKSVKKQKKQSKKKHSPIPRKLTDMVTTDVERYLDIIGMNHYRTKTIFMKQDDSDEPHCCGKGSVAAAATVGMRYLTVTVKVYPFLVNQWMKGGMTDEDVHEIISHEMAHVATNHLFYLATSIYKDEGETKDAWESLTTIVGRLVHEVDKRRRGYKKSNEK
jgi:hypothetical protein